MATEMQTAADSRRSTRSKGCGDTSPQGDERVSEHLATPVHSPATVSNTSDVMTPGRLESEMVGRNHHTSRVGKAPPIDTFTVENCDVLWEDWLPTFEWAASWNNLGISEGRLYKNGIC